MNLDFDKIWASDTSPDYPSDTQAKRGLSFLGTEPPTFDLHDAIFQRLDKKDRWLYDQVRLACERFGQNVSESVAGASRDTMANAITNALLTQRKADEGGYGIVKMANADQTNAGQEYNLAVSPKHLSEYVSTQNTWENTKDKPQTATRWPDYSEVKNTPLLGSAAYKSSSDFDAIGEADKVKKLCVLKDYISYAGCVGGDGTDPYFMLAATGGLVRLATREFARQQADDLKGSLGSAAYKSSSDFDAIGEADKVNKELQDYKTEVQNSYVKRDFVKTLGLLNGRPYVRSDDDVITQLADTDDLDWLRANLVYRDGIAVLGKLSDGTLYVKDSSSNIDVVVKKTELSDGAYMWKSSAGVDGLVGDAKEVMTTAQGVELRNMTVRKVRLGQPVTYDMQSNTSYSQSGHVISSLRITGAVDGSMDSITLRPIQYLINGTWYTAEQA